MVNKIVFNIPCANCVGKILVLEKGADEHTLTLKAVDKGIAYKPKPGSITKINEIAKILQKQSTKIEADNNTLTAVATRINLVKNNHDQSPLRRIVKKILPKFILEWLPFACLKEHHGLDLNIVLQHKAASEEEAHRAAEAERAAQSNLDATLEPFVNTEDIEKEARLFGVDPETAKRKMLKRLNVYLKAGLDPKRHSPSLARRQETTGYELSILKAIEKTFKKSTLAQVENTITPLQEHGITVIVSGQTVVVEEKVAGIGAFKVATFSSDYFGMMSPLERQQYVTLRNKENEKSRSGSENLNRESSPKPTKSEEEEILPAQQDSNRMSVLNLASTVVVEETDEVGSFVIKESTKRKPIPSFGLDDKSSVVLNSNEVTNSFVSNASGAFDPKELLNSVKKADHAVSPKETKYVPAFINAMNYDYDDPANFQGMPFEQWRTGALKRELDSVKKALKIVAARRNLNRRDLELTKAILSQMITAREASEKEMNSYVVPDDKADYLKEIEITQQLQGKGVVKVFKVINMANGEKIMLQKAAGYRLEVPGASPGSTQEITAIDLKKLASLQRKGKLNEQQKQQLFVMLDDAFHGIERMHAMGFIHRDLKPENILVTKEGRGALADFGTVCRQKGDLAKSRYFGSPRFSAPELCTYADGDRWKYIDEKSDVWSCAMILMNCCFKGISAKDHPAIKGTNPEVIKTNLQYLINKPKENAIYEMKFPEPENKNSLDHLIWEATRVDPAARPTMAEFRRKFNQRCLGLAS